MKKILFGAFALCSLTMSAQTSEEESWFYNLRPERVENMVTDENGTRKELLKVGSANQGVLSVKSPKIPVILVQFNDRPFSTAGKTDEEVRNSYELFFNSADADKVKEVTGSSGSISAYFNDMSRGAFLPQFDLIGPLTLDNGYAVYGGNHGNYSDVNINAFFKDALSKAVNSNNVNWNQYDNDGNGTVDVALFIYAGWGENVASVNGVTVDPDAIWPKEGPSGLTVTDDNGTVYKFGVYGVTAEARYIDRSKIAEDIKGDFPNGYNPENMKMDGVGVCIHEFTHALGLPDFYDTKNVAFGMDLFSIMDYGQYCNNGYTPVGYTAYERNFMGWEELPVLSGPQVLTIPCFADGGHGYKIVNPGNPDEYYVIENRQAMGWDVSFGKRCHGLMVSHVDYDKGRWLANTVNTDANHQRMTIIAANNSCLGTNSGITSTQWIESLSGNLYPGSTLNYNLTDESTPAASVYTANNGVYFMSQPLRNITENEDGTVTVCFCTNGQLSAPEMPEVSEVTENSFTVNWRSVENAKKYEIEIQIEDGVPQSFTTEETAYAFADLKASTHAKCRVKAMADMPEDYVDSDWSEYVYIQTDADYLESIPDSEKQVVVYSMNGSIAKRCKASELHCIDLQPGVYVIKYSNGSAKKVIMK